MRHSNINININKSWLKTFDFDEFYKQLKVKGFKFENQANGYIQQSLNKEWLIQLSSLLIPLFTQFISGVQQKQESSAGLLNIPTKSDLANTARLIIDTQEKIDMLEEHIWQLVDLNERLLELNLNHHQVNEQLGGGMKKEQNPPYHIQRKLGRTGKERMEIKDDGKGQCNKIGKGKKAMEQYCRYNKHCYKSGRNKKNSRMEEKQSCLMVLSFPL
ncbi:hypothetical protein [Priestia filamentosa]|uniref:hypothetical protein n=1 Tax=Priestia filamentosa TaxID=1402861 RepID=UPI001314020C|nr:hypothetical protein [Priestia filamentosa]